jgi:hypothetical protein
MLDSQARIVEPLRRMALAGGDAGDAERAVSFPFRVQWTTLFVALEAAKTAAPSVALYDPPPADFTATNVPKNLAPRVGEGTKEPHTHDPTPGSSVQWEMVVPKMVRPSARISPATEIAPPPLPRPSPRTLQPADQPRNPDPDATPDSIPQIHTARRWSFRFRPRAASLAAKLLVGGALAAGVTIPVLMRVYSPQPHASIDAAIHGGGWMREPSAPVGASGARTIVLYRPSLGATDCRLEFMWTVSDRALAWTFRTKDPDNYYAMAIKALRPGPSPTLSVEHFTVYRGIESQHASKVLILPENSPALQIRMDVTGGTFKLYLQGNAADYWTDSRLAAGGLGFLEQPDQPAEVQSVRMTFSEAGGA